MARDMYRPTVRFGVVFMLIAGVLLVITGDFQAKIMFEQQPMKMASAEALCETQESAPFSILTVGGPDRKSTRLNSSHVAISYAVFCLKKKRRLTPLQPHHADSK